MRGKEEMRAPEQALGAGAASKATGEAISSDLVREMGEEEEDGERPHSKKKGKDVMKQ